MASQPYQRRARSVGGVGISSLPPDQLPPNKVPFLQNMRTYVPGTLQPRSGIALVSDTPIGSGINAIARLNDQTAFATVHQQRFVGAGTHLYGGNPNIVPTTYVALDNGYSGDPLTLVTAAPPQSPRPYLYVADRSRLRKINTDRTLYPVGLKQPLVPPSVTLQPQGLTVVSDLETAAGVSNVGAVSSALGTVNRINTTIAAILYDTGNTGYASIQPTDPANIAAGSRIIIAGAETCVIEECIPAVAGTTIASIVYDAGTTGLCWIQPVGSLGVGQLDPVPYAAYLVRAGTGARVTVDPKTLAGPLEFGVPPDLNPQGAVPRHRTVDFPVNGLVTLGGAAETVRIQAVAIGPDGVQAFRCFAANTHAATDTITGLATFRVSTTGTRAAGNALTNVAVNNLLTGVPPTGASQVAMVGGISAAAAVNAALIGGRAALADDILHVSIKVDKLTYVQSVRLYLDVDAAGAGAPNAFLQNYYFAEWRASDIVAAIQATNAASVVTITDALPTAVVNDQVDPGPTGGTGAPQA